MEGGSGSQCYCLRWNNYQSSVVTVMRSLLRDRAFLDVTLACDGRSLQAHRLMLASCSDFFSDVLKENQTEHPIIFLRDVNFWELEAIMDFIYNGQVNIMQEQLPGFIRTAETLQIKGLAAVNSNNNSPFSNNNNTLINNNNSSTLNNNNNVENLSMKYNAHLQDLKYNSSHINNNNNNNCSSSNRNSSSQETKYDIKHSPPPHHHALPGDSSPPPTPYSKRRRHGSPPPSRGGSDSPSSCSDIPPRLMDGSPGSTPSGGCGGPELSPLKGVSPSPLTTINDTIQSLALSCSSSPPGGGGGVVGGGNGISSSVASMASISVAKAISLSKLVHEISSQASIASLKSAALPPHHPHQHPLHPHHALSAAEDAAVAAAAAAAAAGVPAGGNNSKHNNNNRDEWEQHEPQTPPPPPPPQQQQPVPHLQNTKDWAANKNEDGFPACSLCGKVFKHQGSLVAHYQVHQQRTKCPVCQKVLSRHYHMKVHLLTVHKVPDSEIDSLLRTQCV